MSVESQLIAVLDSMEFGRLLEFLKSPEINQQIKSTETVINLIVAIATIFDRCTTTVFTTSIVSSLQTEQPIVDEIIYECCRLLRNSCAMGHSIQNRLIGLDLNSHRIFDPINAILRDVPNSQPKLSQKTRKMCWQFLTNLCVQNNLVQRDIWGKCIEPIIYQLNCVCCTENGRECTMILYNLVLNDILSTLDVKKLVELLLQCLLERDHVLNDFYQLFMEHLITKYRSVVSIYDKIMPLDKRIHLIYYIADHMKAVRHEPISVPLLQFMCKEFKKKSDCILRVNQEAAHNDIHPKEVIALLEVIAQASSDERYAHILSNDSSLFLNVGCLLRTIHDIGQKPSTNSMDANIFAPVQKLTQLAPNSNEDSSIERDISYQLKSMLIRILANLAYKNKKNEDLAREMEFIMVVLDSTALYARNPLIKEWSNLAVRNLCENNFENQTIIRQLTKVGDSKSDIINELDLDLGSLRINPNVQNDPNIQ